MVVIAMLGISGCRERYEPTPDDAGSPDAYAADAASFPDAFEIGDAGPPDAGATDVGPPDGGPVDAGLDAGRACRGPQLGAADDAAVAGPDLYVTGSCTELSPGVRPFVPRYVLWSDDAEKERFVYLPPGSQIDASDPDGWIFPVGTTFWKHFRRDGLLVETRVLRKVGDGAGPGAWSMRTFVWNMAQDEATEVTAGVPNALGTAHDIPPTTLCVDCHSGAAVDVGLGFSAIELNHREPGVALVDLNNEGLLSPNVPIADANIPGTTVEQAALGYLHINCGPCHGGPSPQMGLRFWVDVATPTVQETGAYQTAVGVDSAWQPIPPEMPPLLRVDPMMPDHSAVIRRMMARGSRAQMPPIASEIPDPDGIAAVRAWINALVP